MMKEKKWMYGLLAVLLVAVLISAGASLFTVRAVQQMQAAQSEKNETTEDNVPIMDGTYTIVSTRPISDAYQSGQTGNLDSKQKEILSMASDVLSSLLKDGMSDYEKEKAVYDWMTANLRYDSGALQVIPDTQEDADNPYGALKYHNAVCVGYATTFRLFMQMMNIECMVVHNTEEYHTWNLVKLGDDWYHVDVYSDQNGGNYASFNLNDQQMHQQMMSWDLSFFPAATGTQYNYAFQNKQDVDSIYAIPGLIRKAADQKTPMLSLKLSSLDDQQLQATQALLNGVDVALSETEAYAHLSVQRSWLPLGSNDYLLALYLSYPQEDDPEFPSTLTQEELEKGCQSINDAFGTHLDWTNLSSDPVEDPFDTMGM
ncbi:MAG: transglutaminase domain-containing protein [Evtepia sp.]|uniref:transglutaminase domain-containing protein n=1 Tax=Evtepia sp. TaxID=2773933 RepID=UPI002A763A54|nr:transglutaminase domain-containing protein [Evtepia sp.]MDY3014769.1 transglutaminase domain-containing protein [Evtepia sp.]